MAPDIENAVYTAVTGKVKSIHSTLSTSSWQDAVPSSFPFALVCQTDEYDVQRTLNSSHSNEFRHVVFEVNVYSASKKGRKSEAKAIARDFAAAFRSLGFIETAGGHPVDLTDDSNRLIARYFCRFEASVSDGGTIFSI